MVRPWREAVKAAALQAMGDGWERLDGPVWLEVTFYYARPRSHYGTGRNAAVLKPSAPVWKTSVPDVSKLARSTEDALTDVGLWRDDALVVRLGASKSWSRDGFQGAVVSVSADVPDPT